MSISENIKKQLPTPLASAITDVELIWYSEIDTYRPRGALLIDVNRKLTLDGDDDQAGFNGDDSFLLHQMIRELVDDLGATGRIDRYVVRGNEHPISDAEIEALFD